MTTFVDTSAIYAVIYSDDFDHEAASRYLNEHESGTLMTHNYVLTEVAALLQARIGLSAVRALHERVVPVLDVVWVLADLHHTAMAINLAAARRSVSFVDRVSFEVMRANGLSEAFAFDDDFEAEGFTVVP